MPVLYVFVFVLFILYNQMALTVFLCELRLIFRSPCLFEIYRHYKNIDSLPDCMGLHFGFSPLGMSF